MRSFTRTKVLIVLGLILFSPVLPWYYGGEQHGEQLSRVPDSESVNLNPGDDMFTYHFRAEAEDEIHIRVSSDRQPSFQVVLIPVEHLDEYRQDPSFTDIEKIEEASNKQTRSFRAHLSVPEEGEYVLVVRSLDSRSAVYNVLIGRGLFSSMVVRSGGFVEFFGILFMGVGAVSASIYLYMRLKEKKKDSLKNGISLDMSLSQIDEEDKERYKTEEKRPDIGSSTHTVEDDSSPEEDYLRYDD